MLCEEYMVSTRHSAGGPVKCTRPAKYWVLASGAPRVVCGNHARGWVKDVLIPLNLLEPNISVDRLPRINAFLEEMRRLGVKVSVVDASVSIDFKNFGGGT